MVLSRSLCDVRRHMEVRVPVMCGLIAYRGVSSTPDIGRASAAIERLAHRGPDGAGIHVLGAVVLAHRRLSIIDIARGGQPLLNEDGRIALVCNGEIYNHQTLRTELQKRHAFRSRSDSEVIVHLYEERGADCVDALDGMFAFVITDGTRLLAARDPLGIKPLYLGRDGQGALWFASELKALTGLCAEVAEFPPGHLLTLEGGLHRWFDARWVQPPEEPMTFHAEDISEALRRAVEKQLVSDVPVGVFLSGGLDSSLLAALMRPHVDELHSFTVGLEGAPDLLAARLVAKHLGTCHHEYVYSPAEAVAAVETIIAHLESYDPALLRSAVPSFFVSRLAAEHVKVVLCGEGADEAFAGYEYLAATHDATTLYRELVRLLSGLHNLNLQRVDRMTMAHGLEARVPFLDTEFLECAMRVDPQTKLHRENRVDKWPLRASFVGLLPDAILWRTKQEFAQGCGSEWTLREHCEDMVSDADLEEAGRRFPEDTPRTKEACHYRRIFDQMFPNDAVRRTVGRWHGAFESH